MSKLNPFASRRVGDELDDDDGDSDSDTDSTQTQSLLRRPSKAPVATRPASPSSKQKQWHVLVPRQSTLHPLRLALVFLLGLSLGFAFYSFFDTGMTDIRDAISAAQRAKRNAAMLAGDSDVEANAASADATRMQEDAFPLRIMTFNLRYGTANDGANSWRYRRGHAADVINRYGPVIIGTQEGMPEQLAELQSLLARPYARFGEPREPNGEYVQIFYDTSVLERLDGGTFWLSTTPDIPGSKGWDGACVRIATWCRFRFVTTRQQFYVVNTHLDSEGAVARYEGAKVVWHEMEKVLSKDALPAITPIFLTGDFNTFRRSDAFQYLTTNPNGPQFQDAWMADSGFHIGNISCTYHNFHGPAYDTMPRTDWPDSDIDPLHGVATNHIDFVLSRPPLPTVLVEVITEAWNGRYPSDHYPVMATLLFPSAAESPPA